jgi:glutamine amidotransferase
MMKRVSLINYGGGNERSMINSLERIGVDVVFSSDIQEIRNCDSLIFHGVGSYAGVMSALDKSVGVDNLRDLVISGVPFLGVCVGMQILTEVGLEFGKHEGLNLLPGKTVPIKDAPMLPHIGWNNLELVSSDCPLLSGISSDMDFYFVHSYAVDLLDKELVKAECNYGSSFAAVIQSNNIFGVQFHPEKSHEPGNLVLRNFLSL